MISATPRLKIRISTLLLPLAYAFGTTSCSLEGTPGGGSGGVAGTGGATGASASGGSGGAQGGTGGSKAGTGGSGTGGTTGGSAGTNAGTGGGTAGRAGNGGANAGTSGGGSGGVNAGAGGGAGTAGANGGTAGTDAGAGGMAGGAGGASAGVGGLGGGGTSGGAGGSGGSSSVFHIFMLMGQSNMAGVATRQASDRNTDERLKVFGGCNKPAGQWNTVTDPPLSECPGEKGWNLSDSVDPGIWFGKTLLEALPAGDTIGLVGTAESGESINTFISGGSHHQMILNKIAGAKTAPNARFAGVIFHQGESDSGQSSWPGKVVQLYNEVKAAFGADYDVPFILGELPAGGCCSGHNTLIHQAADMLPLGHWVSQQGTAVMDEYHFNHDSVVLMGQRYGETMIEALGW